MNDLELDREIAAALHVDPSPEFLARVRMRVASEPAPAPWRMRWMVLAGAAAAVAVMAVVVSVWATWERGVPQQAVLPDFALPPEQQGDPATPPAPTPIARLTRTPAGVPADRQQMPPAGVPGDEQPQAGLPPFPEVLISQDEVRAYQRLLGIADQQRLPPSAPPARARDDVVDLHDIDLASLKIEALPPMARLEGARP